MERVRRELQAYGNGKITGGRWIDLAAEAAFFDGICRGKKVHEPSLYCMYEHKEIMRRRIEYLSDRGLKPLCAK